MNARHLWIGIYLAVFVWSAIKPYDYPTWVLEVLPAVIAFVLLAATEERFPLTPLLYLLVLIHAVILMIGGHYTYAQVPLFDWIAEVFNQQRNDYDKLGHFAQGFIPAIAAREILIRNSVIARRGWLNIIILCVVLAISAFYELLEWWVALLSGEAAEAFLATQGYEWDTQADMGWALFGGILSLVLLSRIHDRQLVRLTGKAN